MISNPDKCVVTFPNGKMAFGHMLEAAKVYTFEEGKRKEIEAQPRGTHVLTFRQKAVDAAGGIKAGIVVHYEDRNKEGGVDLTGNWEVLSAFDPYGKSISRPSLETLGKNMPQQQPHPQSGKWTACLVIEK